MKNLSICITSCNRLKYLKSLLISLEEFKEISQIIVADMGSTESGLREYLESLDWVEKYYHNDPRDTINDEYIGRNKLIEMSNRKYLAFLQDDAQFIGNKLSIEELLYDFEEMNDCYVIDVYGVRKSTLRSTLDICNTIHSSFGRKYWRRLDRHYPTTGFYKRDVIDRIGKYPTNWPNDQSYWGKSENWYDDKFKKSFPNGQIYKTTVPLMLSIWNDKRGGYSFIRGDKRYGYYLDPVDESGLYYKKNIQTLGGDSMRPLGFVDVAEPIGWNYARDEFGDQKKYPQTLCIQEGPVDDI